MQELTPLIYTPVVGEACQRWSEIYQQPEGESRTFFFFPPNLARQSYVQLSYILLWTQPGALSTGLVFAN